MRKSLIIVAIIIMTAMLYGACRADSLLPQSGGLCDLYGTRTAAQVGDVITIVFNEKTVAGQSAKARLKNTFKTGADEGKGFLDQFLGAGVSGGETNDVESSTIQQNNLNTTMSAVITEVLPNGQLSIKGTKTLEVNHETQKVTVTGTIRERDVSPTNTIESTKIANMDAKVNGLPVNRSVKHSKGGIVRWILNILF